MKYVHVEHWTTVAVTALPPGWVNVYAVNGKEFKEMCPALLLQEHRETNHAGDERNVTSEKMPYDTRVVFAATADVNGLDAACDVGNYIRTEFLGSDTNPILERAAGKWLSQIAR